jgi:hypothetical protein
MSRYINLRKVESKWKTRYYGDSFVPAQLYPEPTPEPSPTPTSTPSPTPTPTATPPVYYYSVFECGDPFGPTYVVKHTSTLSAGNSVKVEGDDFTCYEVSTTSSAPEDYIVSQAYDDCGTCQSA